MFNRENLLEKLNEEKQKTAFVKKKLINLMANESAQSTVFVEDFEMSELQYFADTLYKNKNQTVFVLCEREKDTYNFVLCGNEAEANKIFSEIKEKFNIKGGGRNGMISGTVSGKKSEILKELQK